MFGCCSCRDSSRTDGGNVQLKAKQIATPVVKGVIGIVFGQRDPTKAEFYVDKVHAGSAADEAGKIAVGDILLQVDGLDIKSPKMLVGRIKGAAGCALTLTLRDIRTGKVKNATLVRRPEISQDNLEHQQASLGQSSSDPANVWEQPQEMRAASIIRIQDQVSEQSQAKSGVIQAKETGGKSRQGSESPKETGGKSRQGSESPRSAATTAANSPTEVSPQCDATSVNSIFVAQEGLSAQTKSYEPCQELFQKHVEVSHDPMQRHGPKQQAPCSRSTTEVPVCLQKVSSSDASYSPLVGWSALHPSTPTAAPHTASLLAHGIVKGKDSRAIAAWDQDGEEDESLHLDLLTSLVGKDGSRLHWAARYGHVPTITSLMRAGIQVDILAQDLTTPLMLAARFGHTDAVSALILHRCSVDLVDAGGCTALMWAARGGRLDAVRELVRNGASLNMQSCSGWTAMMFAATNWQTEVVALLVQEGANVHLRNSNGETALQIALANARLMACKADVVHALEK